MKFLCICIFHNLIYTRAPPPRKISEYFYSQTLTAFLFGARVRVKLLYVSSVIVFACLLFMKKFCLRAPREMREARYKLGNSTRALFFYNNLRFLPALSPSEMIPSFSICSIIFAARLYPMGKLRCRKLVETFFVDLIRATAS